METSLSSPGTRQLILAFPVLLSCISITGLDNPFLSGTKSLFSI